MFCYQCQEAAKGVGCTTRGVCGKSPDVSALQDELLWLLKGLSFYGVKARELGVTDPEADLFVAQALFATITNANFDPDRFVALCREAIALRDRLAAGATSAPQGTGISEPRYGANLTTRAVDTSDGRPSTCWSDPSPMLISSMKLPAM